MMAAELTNTSSPPGSSGDPARGARAAAARVGEVGGEAGGAAAGGHPTSSRSLAAPAPALTSGMALRRSISAGCPTALEASDDTNNSAADFAVTTPNPRKNSVAPTETACAPTVPTAPPAQPNSPGTAKKKKCKKHKRSPGSGNAGTAPGNGNTPAYAAKKKCKKKRK